MSTRMEACSWSMCTLLHHEHATPSKPIALDAQPRVGAMCERCAAGRGSARQWEELRRLRLWQAHGGGNGMRHA